MLRHWWVPVPHRSFVRAAVVCAALLVLAGCARGPARGPGSADSTSATPDSGGAASHARHGTIVTEWVALGNEPFWNVSVMPDSIVWRTPEQLAGVRFPPADQLTLKERHVWRTSRTGSPASLQIIIERGTCGDGMSDREYPYTSRVRLDTLNYTGCAEQRAVWTDAAAGFTFRVPAAWEAEWDAAIYEGAEAATRGSGARTVVEFTCQPVTPRTRTEILLAVVVLDRAGWAALRAEEGPPPGELLGERGDRVWVAGLPQSQPYPPGTPDAQRFERMQLTIDQVKHAFALLPAP